MATGAQAMKKGSSEPRLSDSYQNYQKVKQEIFADYDKDIIPLSGDGTPVKLDFGLAAICLDLTTDGILKGHFW